MLHIYWYFTLFIDWMSLPLCLAGYGGHGGLKQTIIMLFFRNAVWWCFVSQFLKMNNDVFYWCQYKTNFLLERWGISNICSHLMHDCETLWSDIDGTDRENITKMNGAWNQLCGYHELKANPIRPGCKHHDTPMKSPNGSSRTCVMFSRGTKWICWGCAIDLGDVFPVCPIDIRPQCFASMHQMRTDIWDTSSFQ